ncbi:MAG: HAD family hydrolase [Verrucomicrobia bacterium]|nr:HAD family hydrolase [Verrucomicrobiota bacterium]
MKSTFRAILFDLDGTLADTLADLANASNWMLEQLGCPTHPMAAYRHMVGDGARNLCIRALPADRQHLLDEAIRVFRQRYGEHCFDLTAPYPGVADLAAQLHADGYKLAVLSNKPDDFTKKTVAYYFKPSPFDLVRGQLPGGPLKPDPATALSVAAELGEPPAQWLYLGDTNTDMRTACGAGMFPVGVLWGFRDREELVASGARELIATPEDLWRLLR